MNMKEAGVGSMPKSGFSAYLEDYEAKIKAEIIKTLRAEEPLTITAISRRTEVTHKTAKKWLLVLVGEGKIVMRQIGGTKLFFLNHKGGEAP